jgi:hypothetical protein
MEVKHENATYQNTWKGMCTTSHTETGSSLIALITTDSIHSNKGKERTK